MAKRAFAAVVLLALLSGGLGPWLARGQDRKPEPPVVPPRKGQRQVILLFNGKDLSGWEGHAKYWSVQEGVLVGKNTEPVPVSTYLLTRKKFSDFRLVFDFQLVRSEMHSGIAL